MLLLFTSTYYYYYTMFHQSSIYVYLSHYDEPWRLIYRL